MILMIKNPYLERKKINDLIKEFDCCINITEFKKNTLIWEEKKFKNRADFIDLLCDYLFIWYDRDDWLDNLAIRMYDNILSKNEKSKEIVIVYLINWNSVEYINWNRWFADWEYDKLIDKIQDQDSPLWVLVVCCRCWLNEVCKWRRDFRASDFYTVIDSCKWKKLNVY